MTTATKRTAPRELAHRTGDGLDVTLLWQPAEERLSVRVLDVRAGTALVLEVPPGDALEAFRHPFAYAARGR
jgi:hypothetical protein